MSYAELTAHKLYDNMHLGDVSDEVKRHLIILMLSNSNEDENMDMSSVIVPKSYEEAMKMGATELECVREDLHTYVDAISDEFHLK